MAADPQQHEKLLQAIDELRAQIKALNTQYEALGKLAKNKSDIPTRILGLEAEIEKLALARKAFQPKPASEPNLPKISDMAPTPIAPGMKWNFGPQPSIAVEQDEMVTLTLASGQPSWMHTTGLAPCVALALCGVGNGFLAHFDSGSADMAKDVVRSVCKDLKPLKAWIVQPVLGRRAAYVELIKAKIKDKPLANKLLAKAKEDSTLHLLLGIIAVMDRFKIPYTLVECDSCMLDVQEGKLYASDKFDPREPQNPENIHRSRLSVIELDDILLNY